MRSLKLTFSLLAVLSMSLGGCIPDGEPPASTTGAGGPSAPSGGGGSDPAAQCADPCTGDELLFGPETFERTTCQPVTETRLFDVAADGDVCVVVSNNGSASARLKIDGAEVIAPSQFNPGVTQTSGTVALVAGQHELSVRLASAPGTSIVVELRACGSAPPPRLCSEVAVDFCEDMGWYVVSNPDPPIGNIVCTVDGRPASDNCGSCSEYHLLAWQDGTPEVTCQGNYSTVAGNIYGGHIPCTCADNLYYCGTWDLQGCIPD